MPRCDRGAALVEFALLVPLLGVLVVALYTGGLAYKQNAALTQAVRDGARFGATVDIETFADASAWMDEIYSAIKSSAGGELNNDVDGRAICIAYYDGTAWTSRTYTTSDAGTGGTASCFSDSQAGATRVQVHAERSSEFDILFRSWNLTLAHDAVARYSPVTN